MARNKHPEETVQKILDVSYRLFLEKGYEHTSIQDIINNLGGLSKGAVYHHFKSKEDILMAVVDAMTAESNQLLAEVRDRCDLTGLEKLKLIFKLSLQRPVQDEMFAIAPNISTDPRLLFSLLRETIDDAAPNYIQPIIEQGIADGSISTEYPAGLAELIMLTANIWMNPMVFDNTLEEALGKAKVFCQMMRGLGLDIVDDEILDRLRHLSCVYNQSK